jgi:hypothetical protein
VITSGKFKLLGIHFNLYKEENMFENFSEKKEYLMKLMDMQGFNL